MLMDKNRTSQMRAGVYMYECSEGRAKINNSLSDYALHYVMRERVHAELRNPPTVRESYCK